MNDQQKLQLQNMIKSNNIEDQTQLIRDLKHSQIIKKELESINIIKEKYKGDDVKISEECINECCFLFTYYFDLFNKIKKDEIDIKLLYKFLDILKKIEDTELDQHEGSFLVGTILKEIYIDSALKKSEKLDKLYNTSIKNEEKQKKIQKITWEEYK